MKKFDINVLCGLLEMDQESVNILLDNIMLFQAHEVAVIASFYGLTMLEAIEALAAYKKSA